MSLSPVGVGPRIPPPVGFETIVDESRLPRGVSLDEIDRELTRRKYYDDPVAFVEDVIDFPPGRRLADYQIELLRRLPREKRLAVRSPNGAGKTMTAALLVLWFALTRDGRDWKVVTTASNWRQLERYLWPEIHKWLRLVKWSVLRRERPDDLALGLRLETGSAFPVASDDPLMIEGAHAQHLLYVFDEAKTIPAGVWDTAEGAFSSAGPDTKAEGFAFAISTPGAPSGRFYEIHARKPGLEEWGVRHITLEETIASGLVSKTWAEARERQWGSESAVYKNRVLGEFADDSTEGIIPLAWVDAAIERYRVYTEENGESISALTSLGVDVGSTGLDPTVLAPRSGTLIYPLRRFPKVSTMATVGVVLGLVRAYGGVPVVDVIGVGAGVVDRLREEGVEVQAFNAGAKSLARDRSGELGFADQRAAAWWHLRELLDPTYSPTVALPPDDLLIGDLTAPRWTMTSTGAIRVEKKDEIRVRLRRSTDSGDAVVQAFAYGSMPVRELQIFAPKALPPIGGTTVTDEDRATWHPLDSRLSNL